MLEQPTRLPALLTCQLTSNSFVSKQLAYLEMHLYTQWPQGFTAASCPLPVTASDH